MADMHHLAQDATDEQIAAQVQRGDTEAFGVLVERYGERIARYGRRFLFGYDDAADAVQDVFVKAYVNIRSFDAGRKFSSWIYRIAHNEFINAIKKKRREPLPFFDPDALFPHPLSQDDPAADTDRREVRAALDRHLADLNPRYREPLVLFYLEELDYKEIADVLRIPVSTVGVRLKRGREALKKRLGDHHHP